MNRRLFLGFGILAIAAGIIASSALFTVHQARQVVVFQFGQPKRVITEPGLNVKWPFIQNVEEYEKRVLNLDPPVERVILLDQNRLLVDAFARYRIIDALEFFKTVRTENGVRQPLGQIVNSSLRTVLGNTTLASVLSEERTDIMHDIRETVNTDAARFGIGVLDVRIRRADLPDEVNQAVYGRMRSEREREASELRAQGFEQAQRIRAGADREATVIRAEAKRESDIQRGQGEAARTRVLNDAYGQDTGFFNFYRSMQAYERALTAESTYMVLSPDSEFFDFFSAVGQEVKD
ncbi:MAG: protease modulator HflC [Kiloniellaceae bacterium]